MPQDSSESTELAFLEQRDAAMDAQASTLGRAQSHANITTTQVYTRLDFQHLAKAYDAAHPRAHAKGVKKS